MVAGSGPAIGRSRLRRFRELGLQLRSTESTRSGAEFSNDPYRVGKGASGPQSGRFQVIVMRPRPGVSRRRDAPQHTGTAAGGVHSDASIAWSSAECVPLCGPAAARQVGGREPRSSSSRRWIVPIGNELAPQGMLSRRHVRGRPSRHSNHITPGPPIQFAPECRCGPIAAGGPVRPSPAAGVGTRVATLVLPPVRGRC
jgi:hypothetical protein